MRLALALALVAALWAPAAAHADSTAGVRVVECLPEDGGEAGSVAFSARMRAVPGTRRMALRIRLLEKIGDGRFQRVSAERLGVWRRSRPLATEFHYEQRVRGLRAGAVYRAVVRYRWHDADGAVIRRTRERSGRCRQPGGLPNLRVRSVEVLPGDVEGTAVYRVRVVNRGTVAALRVGVLLRVDGEVVDEDETIDVLRRGESRTVTFNGPICRQRVRAIVDPKDEIAESRERDNERVATCL